MRILVETDRFRNLLKAGLICKGKGLMDSIVGEFTEKGLTVRDISLDVVGVHAIYPKHYFIEYQTESTNIPFTQTLLDQLESGFTSQNVTVECKENTIWVRGEKEEYKENLIDKELKSFPVEMTYSEIGFVPKKFEPKIQVLISSDSISSLPKADEYKFISDGSILKVEIRNAGVYTKELILKQKWKLESLSIMFDGEFLQHILANLYGDVWLSIDEKALVLSQKTKDYLLTFLQSSLEVI